MEVAECSIDNQIRYKTITLVLTNYCNLHCVYCYEKNKNLREMSFETAKKILDNELIETHGYDIIEIDLFGGEPLFCFHRIKEIVEYVKEAYQSVNFKFCITTNGTLLNDEMKKYFVENKKYIELVLSIDGTREMHNINRMNSFDSIDLDFFKKYYRDEYVKMTLSPLTIGNLAEGVIFLHQQGFKVACNLALGEEWNDEAHCEIFKRELIKLANYYLNHPESETSEILNVDRISTICYNEGIKVTCGAGVHMCAYDTEGISYPCQRFLPLSIGIEKAKKAKQIKFCQGTIDEARFDSECLKCILKNTCMTCYGSNYEATGDIYKHDKRLCNLLKVQYYVTACFAIKLFKQGRFETYEKARVAGLLKSCKMIIEEFEY